MKFRTWSRSNEVIAAVAALVTSLLTAEVAQAQGTEGAAYVEDRIEATATVVDIDRESRLITLMTAQRDEVAVEAGPEVRNFDQIEKGDEVSVVYYQAVAAELTEAPADGSADSQPMVVGAAKGAAPGEKPSGRVGAMVTAVVTIDSVDPATHMVKFTGPGGQPREVTAMRPEMQAFVARLKPGDRVKVTYGESLAVAVNPSETEEAE